MQTAAEGTKAAQQGHALAVTWELNGKGKERDGTCELRTTCSEWGLEEIVRTYWRLAEIEGTFRSLKSEMGLRPVFRRKRGRIRVHLCVAVLACYAVHQLRRQLMDSGIHDGWTTIRDKLAHWDRVTTRVRELPGHNAESGSG